MTTVNPLLPTVQASQEIRITAVEPFLLHVPVTNDNVADSMHRLTHWGMPGVVIHSEAACPDMAIPAPTPIAKPTC